MKFHFFGLPCGSLFLAFIVILSLSLISPPASASMEGKLYWSAISFQTAGIDSSGPISVQGHQIDGRITDLSIEAFGKKVTLTPPHIEQLKGVHVNGIQATFCAGYKETGGRTVYISLTSGFASGVKELTTITYNEQGEITVGSTKDVKTIEKEYNSRVKVLSVPE